jgi:valyl-tRNA synthetase
METGYDILFFWVARMILMTTYATGDIPFETVYLHGLIRTRDGKKMSKSDPSTMIDPLDIIPKYGADALRLSMIVGQSPGADSRLYEEKIGGFRNFINKLWNASRFVLMQCEQAGVDPHAVLEFHASTLADRALLHELVTVSADVTKSLEQYRLSEAGDRLYGFVWDFFCDWYLELSKGEANVPLLVNAMRFILQLLHPFCPFVTEELWEHFKAEGEGLLIRHPWLEVAASGKAGSEAAAEFQVLISVVTAIRKLRSEQNVEQGKEVTVMIVSKKHAKLLESQAEHIKRLGRVGDLAIDAKTGRKEDVVSAFLSDTEVHLSLVGLIDREKERAGLEKEVAQVQKYLASSKAKLGNESFVARAPEAVVKLEREKMKDAEMKLRKMEERRKTLL